MSAGRRSVLLIFAKSAPSIRVRRARPACRRGPKHLLPVLDRVLIAAARAWRGGLQRRPP
jgi:hypothetical protein